MSKEYQSKDIEQLLTEQTAVILEAVDKRLEAQDKRMDRRFATQNKQSMAWSIELGDDFVDFPSPLDVRRLEAPTEVASLQVRQVIGENRSPTSPVSCCIHF